MNTSDVVTDRIHALLERYNPVRKSIAADTELAGDLSIDSTAAMNIIMEIEESFGIDIPVNAVSELVTVDDLIELVRERIASAAPI